MTEWTLADQNRALLEGWGVFDNSDHGIQIEKYDASSKFKTDDEAAEYVALKAAAGHALARKAIAYIKRWRKVT